MYATITINDHPVQLKASLFSHLLYKQTFGRELNSDAVKTGRYARDIKETQDQEEQAELYGAIRTIYYQILWTFAKAADSSIQPFSEWLDSIKSISFTEVCEKVQSLLDSTSRIERKNAEAAAAQTTQSQE